MTEGRLQAADSVAGEALGQPEIADPDLGLSERPASLVEVRGHEQTIPDPAPGLSDIARKGGELAFLTLRVINSDVRHFMDRLPTPPRILNVRGRHARQGLGETTKAGEQPVSLRIVNPVESVDSTTLRLEGD